MKTKSLIQPINTTLKELLFSVADNYESDYIGFASAYCTVSGIRKLENIIMGAKRRQILVGLDDYITHPSAIKIMQNSFNCSVRIAGVQYTEQKFHPKVFFLGNQSPNKNNILVISSANLTKAGLTSNIEAATITMSESIKDKKELLALWKRVWNVGLNLDELLFNKYEKEFIKNNVRVQLHKPQKNILESDDASIDPSCASTCWIEVGKITGFNAEQLEIKAEQALFFGLPLHGGLDADITVRLTDRAYVEIPVRYKGNAMWRLNLPDTIPEVHAGLRPKGKRSPYVAIFTKYNEDISLKFIKNDSSKFRKLIEKSKEKGTLGQTAARLYGWY